MMEDLPGADLALQGMRDLAQGEHTPEALLVAIGRPRLTDLGLSIAPGPDQPEHALFFLLQQSHGDGAHSAYNALIRRLVSFERGLERRRATGS